MTNGQAWRVAIAYVGLFLAHSILSRGITDPVTQLWVSIAFTVGIFVTGGIGFWLTRPGTRHPSAVRARIREGLERGRRSPK